MQQQKEKEWIPPIPAPTFEVLSKLIKGSENYHIPLFKAVMVSAAIQSILMSYELACIERQGHGTECE